MIIIPAIDIKDGNVVRLKQGKEDAEVKYFSEPLEAAKMIDEKVELVHIVDLNGAFRGNTKNIGIVKDLYDFFKGKHINIEIGGGIRTFEDIEKYLKIGIKRIIIGTSLVNEDYARTLIRDYGEYIIAGIDANDGNIVISGWVKKTNISSIDFIKKIQDLGVLEFIYTDVKCDGMLSGPNMKALQEISAITKIPYIASGGISEYRHLENLKKLSPPPKGVIIGKAIYDGKLSIKKAIQIAS